MEDTAGSCFGVPSHQHIHVRSLITGLVDGVPQRDIRALQVRCVSGVHSLQCSVKLPYVLILISIMSHCESRVLSWSFLATACLPGHWIVEEVMSLHVSTQWRLSCSPSPPQSPLLTFLSTQDHQKPGAASNSKTALIMELLNDLYELPD